MAGLFAELKRRNVFKIAALYVVGAWLILQITDVMFPLFGLPQSGIQITASILALGFIPALIFSWIYEFTPKGLMRESEILPEDSVTAHTGRRIDRITIAALMSVIALLLAERFWPDEIGGTPPDVEVVSGPMVAPPAEPGFTFTSTMDQPIPDHSVAVLPFVNMSTDEENEHFADGLSETLLHQLSQIKGLKVPARTSSFAFKGRDLDVREIGQLLGVATVLEGSVQKSGNQLRIIAQLVSTSDGSHLWSKNFDRELEDIFAVQDEIARAVATALSETLLEGSEEVRQVVNLDAYEALIIGQREVAKRTVESLLEAEEQFQRAIEIDPDYARAYVGLGTVYQLQISYADRPISDAATLSEPLARQAIELDPDLADAWALLGIVLSSEQLNEESEEAFLKAIDLNPNLATAYHWYSLLLTTEFRFEEALQVIRKAEELDPLSDIIQHNVASRLTALGRVEEAMAVLRRNMERNPEFPNYFMEMGVIQRFTLGRMDEAMRLFQQYEEKNPGNINNVALICTTWVELKEDLKAESCLKRLMEQAPDKLAPRFSSAQMAMLKGDLAKAESILSSIVETNPELPGARRFRATIRSLRDNYDGAIEDLKSTDPELFDPHGPRVDQTNFFTAVSVGYAVRQQGDIDRSDALFDRALDIMSGLHRTRGLGYGVMDMFIHTIRGDHDQALTALREAIDAGWRNNWRVLEIAPQLAGVRKRQEFQSMVAELEADMLAQRTSLDSDGSSAALMK